MFYQPGGKAIRDLFHHTATELISSTVLTKSEAVV